MANQGCVQDSADRTVEKTRALRHVITAFTGQPPKDCEHIYDFKRHLEQFHHPHSTGISSDVSGTTPVGHGDVWNRMTDWDQLSEGEQQSTKAFLMEKFPTEDLELAYDEYYPKFGHLPSVHDFRVFILNWEVQMKTDLELKDTDIEQLTNRATNLQIALNFAVNNSVNQQQHIDTLVRDNSVLQDTVNQVTAAKTRLCHSNNQLVQDNRQLSEDNSNKERSLAMKDRINSCLKREVKQQKDMCNELNKENNKLYKENTQKDDKIHSLQTENTQKDDTISTLQTENTQKDDTISTLKTENTQLHTENTQKDDTISTLQTENTKLHTENTQKDDTISTLQTENTQKDDTISTLQTENIKKGNKVSNLKKDNVLLRQKLQEETHLCEQKDREIKIQKTKIDELYYQMSETSERIARLEEVNEEKSEENRQQAIHINDQNQMISSLKTKLQEQESINKDLYAQMAELRQLVMQQLEAA